MSQEKSDIFKMDIGNLKLNENCQIRISYVCELKMENYKIRFRLPQSIAPRYNPTEKWANGTRVTYGERINIFSFCLP